MTKEISYSEIKRGLKGYMDQVCKDHKPLLVIRHEGGNVILISEDDYRSLEETLYLSSSPKNLARILAARDSKVRIPFNQVRKDLGI